jgi:rubrerythrin
MKNIFRPLVSTLAVLGLAVAAHAATTLDNLAQAFAGESNAAHRYAAFAQKADQEGYAQVAVLFRAAARAEEIHRNRHSGAIKKLGGTPAEIKLDDVKVGTTAENLRAAIAGESYERDTMYPAFIAQAKADDARPAVRSLNAAMSAEKEHAKLFQQALDTLGQNTAVEYYVCRDCGYTVTRRPTKECPVCREDPSKFQKIS